MKKTFLSGLVIVASIVMVSLAWAGAKSNGKKAEGETEELSTLKVSESQSEKTNKAPHATGKERASEVGKGKKKGLEKQGYEIGHGDTKAPKPSGDEGEETEPAIVIGDTSSDKPEKVKKEPKSDSGKSSDESDTEETTGQGQRNQEERRR